MNYKNLLIVKKNWILLVLIIIIFSTTILVSAEIEDQIEKETTELIATPANATVNPGPIKSNDTNSYSGFDIDEIGTKYIKNGKEIRNKFITIKEELYYFDEDGYMVTGWYYNEVTEKWYYFGSDGVSETSWIYDEYWYYIEDGNYMTGWKEILSEDGTSYWFCFDETGKMYYDCQTPDGYWVNEDGVYIPENADDNRINDDSNFEWNRDTNVLPGELSGLYIAGEQVELYMLCIAGETSGLSNLSAVKNGDKGCAYGICQLDYRYDLVGFLNFAYEKHPELWSDFKDYLNYKNGNPNLRGNDTIGNTFIKAMNTDYETAISDQFEYMTIKYWDDFKIKMNNAGFNLDNRHIAVSAALFSVNVNCGSQANVFIKHLTPDMSDEEMIREIYHLRNTVFAHQKVGTAFKGTTTRYRKSEPQMALDLLYGFTTVDSNIKYGGGVEWHGNPFSDAISTIPAASRKIYAEKTEIYLTSTESIETKLDIPEAQETFNTEHTLEETIEETEVMVQLIDGTWIEKSKAGPGYEYMPENIEESSAGIEETKETIESLP